MVTERSEGCLYTLSSLFPASCGPIQTQRSTPSAKPESTDPGWLSSSLPIADQEAADGVLIMKRVESFHPRGAFPSLGLLPSPSLILLQGSPMSHLSTPPASLAPASRHHQCLPTAHCMTPCTRGFTGHCTHTRPLSLAESFPFCRWVLPRTLCCCFTFHNFALKGELPKTQVFVSFVP